MEPGTAVRIKGLVKAAQHNGKLGRLSARKGEDGRVGVQLRDGQVLSVRPENLEAVAPSSAPPAAAEHANARPEHSSAMPEQRTLTRHNDMLREFNGSPDPDVLALYYFYKDMAFDCFNAPEYNDQMLRYYAAGMSVVAVVPRTIRENEFFLVCLQHSDAEKNSLCQVAYQCMRQFAGISMLVKKRCFTCNKPGASVWACKCVCFCSKECATA